jgi:hypothetical protein
MSQIAQRANMCSLSDARIARIFERKSKKVTEVTSKVE